MRPSASNIPETGEQSTSFHLLHEKIQRWIWQQGWTELRDAQEAAIQPVLEGKQDVIIAAATASGKTEAAFLPILSRLLRDDAGGECVIYLSPLKALINDQFGRMEQLCGQLSIPVHPWHGDISSSRKHAFLKKPAGILLITPESLEALLVRNGHDLSTIFSKLSYIVVDELHSFIGEERGRQLQSLLHRIDCAAGRSTLRIGLSATLGDMRLAADFLRPGKGADVSLIVSRDGGQGLKLLLRGYIKQSGLKGEEDESESDLMRGGTYAIAEELYQTLRGSSNLVFANQRTAIELLADRLRIKCEKQAVPNEFWPHHGSLSKELREEAEAAIKDKTRPVSVICTNTLEMGVDIGSVASVAQVGCPPSVASLRQRLGRSGRRGEPSVLRIFICENEINSKAKLADKLRTELVQTIAMVQLLLAKWYEPPVTGKLHLSTLVQQIMALIAQYGGVTAQQAWRLLCETGAFKPVTQQMFMGLLREMGKHLLIMQSSDGLLLHGELGEKIVNHYDFYAVFATNDEFRIVNGSRTLGTLPVKSPLTAGSFLIFGGRRWMVVSVDEKKRVIDVKPSGGGTALSFVGDLSMMVHDRVRQEMKGVYQATGIPVFLDAAAKKLLIEARENFDRYELASRNLVLEGKDTLLFGWSGDRTMQTLVFLLANRGLEVVKEGVVIRVSNATPDKVSAVMKSICDDGMPSLLDLAESVKNKVREKYDRFLPPDLLNEDYAAACFDLNGAERLMQELCSDD